MKQWNNTTMGKGGSQFPGTRWSLLVSAQTDDDTRRRMVLSDLATAYWKPIYCYIRKQGYANEDAKELTQAFFCAVVLEGRLIEKADSRIGSFRGLLMVAIKRFLINADLWQARKKRRPEAGLLNLDPVDLAALNRPDHVATPEAAFYRRWISDLLDGALAEVKEEYCGTARNHYWDLFFHRVLVPTVDHQAPVPLKDLCAQYGIPTETQASNMIVTVKRRFRSVLKRRLRDLVRSEAGAEQEFEEILRFLSEESAR